MSSPHSRFGRSGRLGGIAALAVTAALIAPASGAVASPKPSTASVKKELDTLNSRVDKLVDQYDKATTTLQAAQKRLTTIDSQVAAEKRVYQGMHERIAQIAAAAYKDGTLDSATTLLASQNPDEALDQMSAFTQLSNNRSAELRDYLAATQRIRREQSEAQNALDSVRQNAAALKKRKATVERAIAKQKALLRKIGTPVASGGSGGSGGGSSYTGSASGPARKALQYLYAQVGKPYIFGGTGPNGYDCSGLTMMAWRAAGVSLPRVVPDQYNAVHHVAKADLQPGDLVFFDDLGHEGMYVGGGRFVHAPHTGTVVKFDSMSNPYWVSHYVGGGRP